MRIQPKHVFTGTLLSVLLSAASAYPAFANPEGKSFDGARRLAQTEMEMMELQEGEEMMGTITDVEGDIVTVEMPDGTTKQMRLSRAEIQRLRLTPGTDIVLMRDGEDIVISREATDAEMVEETVRIRRTRVIEEETVVVPAEEEEMVEERETMRETTTTTETESQPVRALW